MFVSEKPWNNTWCICYENDKILNYFQNIKLWFIDSRKIDKWMHDEHLESLMSEWAGIIEEQEEETWS